LGGFSAPQNAKQQSTSAPPRRSLDDDNMAVGLFIAKMEGQTEMEKKGEIVLGTKTAKQQNETL